MVDAAIPVNRGAPESKPLTLVIDIMIVAAVSVLLFHLEGLIHAKGWLMVGAEARGASSVIGGAVVAVCLVLARGGSLADLGFRRPEN